MHIKKIEINGFGKLIDKTVEFKDGINLILGKNESGKSTIADYIKYMFYGISKNKGSKEQSDFERFRPWESGKYGGTLEFYNDERKINIFRDFNHNNTTVTDENGNDISKEYDIDKSKGTNVGTLEFKVDYETFDSVFVVKQNQVSIGSTEQKELVQKMINYMQSGSEDFSYNEIKRKLEKVLNDEIGTDRTTTKPKYILTNEIKNLENDLKNIKEKKKELNILIQEKDNNKKRIEIVDDRLQSLKTVLNEKKQIYQELTNEKLKYDAKVEALKEQERETKRKNKIKKTIDIAMIVVSMMLLAISLVLIKQYVFVPFVIAVMIIGCIINNKYFYKEVFDYGEIDFKNRINSIRTRETDVMDTLINNGIDKKLTEKTISELNDLIEQCENEQNELKLRNHEFEIQCSLLTKEIERENLTLTKLSSKRSELSRLTDKEYMIRLSLEKLDEASEEIRSSIIPELENHMGKILSKITNKKYEHVKYSKEGGILIKNNLGNMVSINNLSAGTIDQIYIAFRVSLCEKYENIPIVFDESFAYSDDERMCEILKALSMLSTDKQIMILSCTNREERIMNDNSISYNKIEI